jgi:putative ABC transport system permease protein
MFGQMTFFVRSRRAPSSLAPEVRRAMAGIDPHRPISNLQTMMELVGDGMRARSYYAAVLGFFALLATALAAAGVYGVLHTSVSQRTREIGIHLALGAGVLDIARLVAYRAIRLAAIGMAAGLAVSLVLAPRLDGQLWGITATDPATYAVAIVFLITVSAVACYIPARRALKVEPREALRMD